MVHFALNCCIFLVSLLVLTARQAQERAFYRFYLVTFTHSLSFSLFTFPFNAYKFVDEFGVSFLDYLVFENALGVRFFVVVVVLCPACCSLSCSSGLWCLLLFFPKTSTASQPACRIVLHLPTRHINRKSFDMNVLFIFMCPFLLSLLCFSLVFLSFAVLLTFSFTHVFTRQKTRHTLYLFLSFTHTHTHALATTTMLHRYNNWL